MDLVRVTFSGGPSGDWLSQFHFQRLLGGTVQDSIDMASNLFVAVHNAMSSQITVHVSADVEQLDDSTGEPTGIEVGTSSTFPGTQPADPLPWQTQARVIWQSGVWVGGRQVRGATFLPAFTEADNTNGGLPSTSLQGLIATAITGFAGHIPAVPVIWSRKHRQAYPIVSGITPQKWSVLRTRR